MYCNKNYHTVGTIPKSWKQTPHFGTIPKSWKKINTTLWEQFQNHAKQKYHTVGIIPKSWRTKNTTLSEQFQNKIEKSQKQEK